MWYLLNYLPRLYVLAPCGPAVCEASHHTEEASVVQPQLLDHCVSHASQRSCNVPRPRAGSHLTPPTETLTSQCLPIPSTILPNYSKFYFFPAQLSCPTYWVHWISFSLHVSLSNSNPPLANVMKLLNTLNHVFYLLQKEIMTKIRCQQLKKFRTPSMIWSGHKAKQAQRTNCLCNLNASYSWSGEMSSSYSGDSRGFRHSYLAPVTSFRVWFLAFN